MVINTYQRTSTGIFPLQDTTGKACGETGSVGPQVAEALTRELGFTVPHVINVDHFTMSDGGSKITCTRRILKMLERLHIPLPTLLTISDDYRSEPVDPSMKPQARANSYRGKIFEPFIWNCEKIGADLSKVGLAGSPTIVGPGYDIGGPRVRKIIGGSLIAKRQIEALTFNDKKYGPFKKGEVLDGLKEEVRAYLARTGDVGLFDYADLLAELFGDRVGVGRA